MTTDGVRHPLCARVFHRLSRLMERELGERRAELLAGLEGRVVELGAGNGMNFGHYPASVEEIVALEPEPYLYAKAQEAALAAAVRINVLDGVADVLPLDDTSVDAAVASLVLCTVPDQRRALSELRRVLKPGGELRFLEHVRSDLSTKARIQAGLDRSGIWPRVAGGCHCSRETVQALGLAGFHLERVADFDLGPSWTFTNPHVLGAARAPAIKRTGSPQP